MARRNAGTKGVPRVDREQQILAVASEEFGTQGYTGTSVASVADRAGISKPLVYNYFGSKDGLYAACLDRAGAILGDEIERIAQGDAVGIARGLRTLEGMLAVLEPQPFLWRLSFDPSAPATGDVADIAATHTARLTKLAHEGVAELLDLAGVTDELDISAMTGVWLGIVDSLLNWWVDHPDQTADEMMQRIVRLVGALFVDAATQDLGR